MCTHTHLCVNSEEEFPFLPHLWDTSSIQALLAQPSYPAAQLKWEKEEKGKYDH